MATRPGEYPEWASGAGASIADPTFAKKQAGWGIGEKPAGPYENWKGNNVFKWVVYFDALNFASLFGDGSDGSFTLDNVQGAVAGLFSKVGSVYTLLRDAFFANLTITGAGVVLDTGCFRLFGTNTLTTAAGGSIRVDGNAAAGAVAGAARVAGTLGGGTAGGAGVALGPGTGGNATNQTNTLGGGAGGAGGTPTNGNGGLGSALTATQGSVHAMVPGAWGLVFGGAGDALIGGGAGGGGGGAAANSGGGGGGGGAGVMAIIFRNLNLAAGTDIHAIGGAGQNGGVGAGTGGGGGGGGGGGNIILCFETVNGGIAFSGAVNCAGGAAGAGAGTGGAGQAGFPGVVQVFNLGGFAGGTGAALADHEERGIIALTGVEVTATATFNLPYNNTPGNVGGYVYEWSIARTDGIVAIPGILLTATATNQLAWTILDPFTGSISWRCRAA